MLPSIPLLHYFLHDNEHYSSENVCMRRRNTCHEKNNKKLEPVSSTSRRGARATYHDKNPRDFGPRIAYTVSLVSDTSRPRPCVGPRSGREGEKCRPLDHMRQIPFIHQLCSHPKLRSISIYIYNCGIYNVSSFIFDLRMRSSRTTYFKVQRHF